MLSLREAIDALLKYAVQNHTEQGKDCEQIASYLGELEHARTRINELEQELKDSKTAWMREMSSNGARIRRMSNEELAQFIVSHAEFVSDICKFYDKTRVSRIIKWLEQEVKTES